MVIDALDECSSDDGTQRKLLKGLLTLQASQAINVMVTSRPIPSIMSESQSLGVLEVQANRSDIQNYLEGQMSRLSKRVAADEDLQSQIINGIIEAADGM